MKDDSKSEIQFHLPVKPSPQELNYSNIEHELLGPLFAFTHFKHFTHGRLVHIITDHKPLVSLFRKSLVDSSPRLTRMLIQLLDYTLDVMYQPGAQIHAKPSVDCQLMTTVKAQPLKI